MNLLYPHYVKEGDQQQAAEYRLRLKAIVEDSKAHKDARRTAFETLFLSNWKGQDEWYLSLFSDPTLIKIPKLDFIQDPVKATPDKWIPVLTRLLGNPNRNVHNTAVSCLAEFTGRDARRDALVPLLPWLEDPQWSSLLSYYRSTLVDSLDLVDIPESVPGLITVLNQDDHYLYSDAADSLAHYRDPRAIPALKKVFKRKSDWGDQRSYIKALIACGGLNDNEAVAAIKALAAHAQSEEGKRNWMRHFTFPMTKIPSRIRSASDSTSAVLSRRVNRSSGDFWKMPKNFGIGNPNSPMLFWKLLISGKPLPPIEVWYAASRKMKRARGPYSPPCSGATRYKKRSKKSWKICLTKAEPRQASPQF